MSKSVRIVEKASMTPGTTMLYGIPDVGLVGLIATAEVESQNNLKEVAELDSDFLPPVTVLHEGLPNAPLHISSNESISVVVSEIAVPAAALRPVMKALLEWSSEKKVGSIISIGGIPVPNRQEIKEPRVFGAASTASLLKLLEGRGIQILKEGYIVGPNSLILRYCSEKGVPAIILLAESFYEFPDPEAASASLKELSKIVDVKVDISELVGKGEEIRLRTRDMMRRTQREMSEMRKSQEYDLPLYV